MILVQLFREFLIIGALSFGGGYGTLALIGDSVVAAHGWLTYDQLADLVTLSEITPGPIALNAASFTGYTAAGIPGAVAATVGCVLPSCLLVSLMAVLLSRCRQNPLIEAILSSVKPVVCALIFSAFLTVGLNALGGVSALSDLPHAQWNAAAVLIFAGALILLKIPKLPPAAVIMISGLCGLILM